MWLPSEGTLVGGYAVAALLFAAALLREPRLHLLWPLLTLPVLLAALLFPRRRTFLGLTVLALAVSLGRIALGGGAGHLPPLALPPLAEAGEHLLSLGAMAGAAEVLFRLARAHRASEQRYRRLFERNLAGVFRAGPDLQVLECNGAFARIFGDVSPEQMRGRALEALCPDPVSRALLAAQLSATGGVRNHELRIQRADGSTGWVLASAVLAEGGAVEGTVVDITERKQAEAAVLELSLRDGLTGLYNRRELDRVLREEVERARRYQRPLSLMLVDVDHFKVVNDTHGHPVGDTVLRTLAGVLLGSTRMTDLVARYGGEEFAVVLRETVGTGACEVAERLRLEVASRFPAGRPELPAGLSVSVGVAEFGPGLPSVEALVEAADRALYEAKQRGRNRVVGRLSA